MLTRWGDIDTTFAWMDELHRRMEQAFREFDGSFGFAPAAGWPRANLYDVGSELVVRAEVPGLSAKDLTLQVTEDGLSLTGERKNDAPEGYAAHRRERMPVSFARSFAFPCKADPEQVGATLKDGLLTVRVAKAAHAQPRAITVKAG
jgi:HSP20 family protein